VLELAKSRGGIEKGYFFNAYRLLRRDNTSRYVVGEGESPPPYNSSTGYNSKSICNFIYIATCPESPDCHCYIALYCLTSSYLTSCQTPHGGPLTPSAPCLPFRHSDGMTLLSHGVQVERQRWRPGKNRWDFPHRQVLSFPIHPRI